MLNLTKIAFAAAIALGSVSLGTVASQASSADENGAREGGFKIGPLGQRMGGSFMSHRYRGPEFGFAYAPGYHRHWHYERDGGWR
jgi:hypothetical protein